LVRPGHRGGDIAFSSWTSLHARWKAEARITVSLALDVHRVLDRYMESSSAERQEISEWAEMLLLGAEPEEGWGHGNYPDISSRYANAVCLPGLWPGIAWAAEHGFLYDARDFALLLKNGFDQCTPLLDSRALASFLPDAKISVIPSRI
jgi:hypothetical protein